VSRLLVVAAALGWCGLTLLLAELRWFRRPGLVERLRRFGPAGSGGTGGPGASGSVAWSVASFREVVGPLVIAVADRALGVLGVNEELAIRLQRLHAPVDVAAFRLRQAAWSAAALGAAAVAAIAVAPPLAVGLLFVLGAPVLAFLVIEQQIASASARRQHRLFAELPVVTEQLGMLLGAGYSLGAALSRLARRGRGVIAEDLGRVTNRIRQGLSEEEALREWGAIAGVTELDRLINVLALNGAGADLGRLVAEEARSARREAHRHTIEAIERRAQMVWIPVTVATLVPGVMFMAIPFIEAMRNFAAL
jgi:Flp pilus assembly protein TadB